MGDLSSLDDETRRFLQEYHFDPELFAILQQRLRSGEAPGGGNRVRGTVEPPQPGEVEPLPPLDSQERRRLTEVGQSAIARGEVGSVVLAGGMATRFGGVVKAAVEVLEDKSFLDLKLADIDHAAASRRGRLPIYLMTSFATDRAIRDLVAGRPDVRCFSQFISLRLTPDGDIFREKDGRPSPYAPGHGDLTFALRRSGKLEEFRTAGGKYLFMSNVDNVTATLDPAIVAVHIESGKALTAELAPKEPGDKGGAPARLNGELQILESFRFPADFDQDRIAVFNTNSFVLSADAIDRDFPLDWFAVQKQVEDRDAIQFEHLVGQLTAFLPSHFVEVARRGPDARFQPVKTPEELDVREPEIREALRARGIH